MNKYLKRIQQFFCQHLDLRIVSNIYGDERSLWQCKMCSAEVARSWRGCESRHGLFGGHCRHLESTEEVPGDCQRTGRRKAISKCCRCGSEQIHIFD